MNKSDNRSISDHLVRRDMRNRKPFRTVAQRVVARASTRVVDGRFVSSAPVSLHGLRDGRPA